MTLKHLTKTIPLSGGLQHDVEEFLQDSPTMTVQDNTRYRKQGEVEKSEPSVLSANAPFIDNVIVGLGTRGDRLFAVAPDGEVAELQSDGTWDSAEGRLEPSINTTLYQSNPVPGAHCYCFGSGQLLLDNSPYYLIAYEKREHNTTPGGALPSVDVVAEVINRDTGRLIDKRTYTDMSSPQIADCGAGPVLFFVNTTGDIRKVQLDNSGTLPSEVSVGIVNGPAHPDSHLYDRYSTTTTARDTYRLGLSEDGGRGASYRVAGDGTSGVLAYTPSTGDNVYFTKLTTGGTRTGVDTSITASGNLILDVAVDGTNAAILWFTHGSTPTSPTYTLRGVTVDITGDPAADTIQTVGTTNATGHVINGGVAISGGNAVWAATAIGRDATEELPGSITDDVKLLTGSFTASSAGPQGVLRNLRLASDVVSSDTTRIGMVVEQYVATMPKSNTNGLATNPVAIRGKTATLIEKATNADNYNIISAFDAGQSLAVNPTSAEQYLQCNTLTRSVEGVYTYINRVVLQPEDITITTNNVDANYSRGRGSWHAGEWRCSIYQVNPPSTLAITKVGNAAVLNTSVASWYAGNALAELSPLEQPEIVFFQNANGTAPDKFGYETPPGANPDNIRVVQCIVGYTDESGQLHRSPPSFPVFVESNVAAVDDGNDAWRQVGITLPLSGLGPNRDYFAEVYIGQGSLPPQLCATWAIPVGTQVASYAEFTFMDSLTSPTNIDPVRSSEVIYTEGGVLPSDAWPDFKDFAVTSNRLWGVSRNVPGTIYYSKLFEPNVAPEFSAQLVIDLGQNRTINAIGSIDDKVVVFTDSEVFAIYDTGPDNTGRNGDFIIDRLTSPFGCNDPESVLEIPDGLMFYSNVSREMHIITRDMQVLDVGKPVMDFTEQDGFNVLASVVYPAEHEARFYITVSSGEEFGPDPDTGTGIPPRPARPKFAEVASGSDCLAYNYHYQKWSRRTSDIAQFAVLHENKPVIANLFNAVYFTGTSWANAPAIAVETPWIRVGQLQSFGRVDELTIIGRYLSSWTDTGAGIEAGDIQVTITYDYKGFEADSDVYRFRANRGDLGTESNDRMQISVSPGKPKCQALKVRIEEVDTTKVEVSEPDYVRGRGFTLSGMDIIYSPKSGTASKSLPKERRK